MALRAVAVLGLAVVPLNDFVLKRLLAIVETVRAGDPFVAASASRLRAKRLGARRAMRLTTLEAICEAPSCQPGRHSRF